MKKRNHFNCETLVARVSSPTLCIIFDNIIKLLDEKTRRPINSVSLDAPIRKWTLCQWRRRRSRKRIFHLTQIFGNVFFFLFRLEWEKYEYFHFREALWFGIAVAVPGTGVLGLACAEYGQKIIYVIKIILKIKETCVLADGCCCWCYCCCCCDYIIFFYSSSTFDVFLKNSFSSWERVASFIWSW